jgi:hypothetical protein
MGRWIAVHYFSGLAFPLFDPCRSWLPLHVHLCTVSPLTLVTPPNPPYLELSTELGCSTPQLQYQLKSQRSFKTIILISEY